MLVSMDAVCAAHFERAICMQSTDGLEVANHSAPMLCRANGSSPHILLFLI
jgi:hypothetical protein